MNLEVGSSNPESQRTKRILSGFQPRERAVNGFSERSEQAKTGKKVLLRDLRVKAKERELEESDRLRAAELRVAINSDVPPENVNETTVSYGASDVQDFRSSHPGPLVMPGDPKYALHQEDLRKTRDGFPSVE